MWHTGFHPIFPIIFFILIFGFFFFFRFFMWRRFYHSGCISGQESALSLLQKRLVNGEINEDEYLRLKTILQQK